MVVTKERTRLSQCLVVSIILFLLLVAYYSRHQQVADQHRITPKSDTGKRHPQQDYKQDDEDFETDAKEEEATKNIVKQEEEEEEYDDDDTEVQQPVITNKPTLDQVTRKPSLQATSKPTTIVRTISPTLIVTAQEEEEEDSQPQDNSLREENVDNTGDDHQGKDLSGLNGHFIIENNTYRPTLELPPFPYVKDRKRLEKLLVSNSTSYTDEELDLLFQAAEDGSGYDPYAIADPSRNEPWNVFMWGRWEKLWRMSGCPSVDARGLCPYYPKCKIYMSNSIPAITHGKVNVLLIPVTDLNPKPKYVLWPNQPTNISMKVYKVGYQREPSWFEEEKSQRKFDFQMSMRYNTAILNPIFLREPSFMMLHGIKNYKTFKEREFFAMSMISDCGAASHRDTYIRHLKAYLGHRRIHEYGSCGDGHFMPFNDNIILQKVSKYKFYFAFENYVEPGYVSEKLGKTLSYGPIPVYYGAPDVLQFTITPSFINVHDHRTPKRLAELLLYLSENETAYESYHTWRTNKRLIHPEYLKLVATQVPGPIETKVYQKLQHSPIRANRHAACCRLCDENWMKLKKKTHLHETFAVAKDASWINENLFNWTIHEKFQHLKTQLIKDDSFERDGHDEFSKMDYKPPN